MPVLLIELLFLSFWVSWLFFDKLQPKSKILHRKDC